VNIQALSAYEVGHALAAIEAVGRAQKPIAEVGQRTAERCHLEGDLLECLRVVQEDGVKPFLLECGPRTWRFGFYREEWALDALVFLDRAELEPVQRAWMSGLLFGYNASAIQRFITTSIESASRSRLSCSCDTEETSHAC
jgi:hypothetical protein